MEVIIAVADEPNGNNRIYPREELEKAIQGKTEIFGTVGMFPESGISLSDMSHVIKDLHFEGNALVGTVQILDTTNGNILKSMLENQHLDFRFSGYGNVVVEDGNNVVREFTPVAINAVTNGA